MRPRSGAEPRIVRRWRQAQHSITVLDQPLCVGPLSLRLAPRRVSGANTILVRFYQAVREGPCSV